MECFLSPFTAACFINHTGLRSHSLSAPGSSLEDQNRLLVRMKEAADALILDAENEDLAQVCLGGWRTHWRIWKKKSCAMKRRLALFCHEEISLNIFLNFPSGFLNMFLAFCSYWAWRKAYSFTPCLSVPCLKNRYCSSVLKPKGKPSPTKVAAYLQFQSTTWDWPYTQLLDSCRSISLKENKGILWAGGQEDMHHSRADKISEWDASKRLGR